MGKKDREMKRFLSLIATICMLATACEGNLFGDQNNDDKNGGSSPKISLSQTKVNVACTDGVYSVKVASPYSWEAQSKNSWIVIDEDACTGIAGSDEVLEFRVEANESEKVRKGTIVIKNSDFQLITELYIAQAAQGQSLEELEKEEGKNEGGNGSGNEGENQGGGGVENEGGNGNPDTPIKEKRLVKVVSGQTDPTTYTFEYDNEGRLIKVVESWEKDTYSDVCTSSYEWGFNKIDVKQVSCSSDGSESYTSTAICSYILDNNGLVTEYTNSDKYINCTIKYYYTYNESNRLTSVTGTDSNDAFVNDWEGAADEMWESTGLDGDFVYNESEDADHIIYAQDTKGGPGVDHFVNSTEPGQYYDPWTGETCDLDTSILQENRPIRGLDFVE